MKTPRNKSVCALILISACFIGYCSASGTHGKPKRAIEIEQKFRIEFCGAFEGKRENGEKLTGWAFNEELPELMINSLIRFMMPVNATDEQAQIAKDAAEYSAGFTEGRLETVLKPAAPSPTPETHRESI